MHYLVRHPFEIIRLRNVTEEESKDGRQGREVKGNHDLDSQDTPTTVGYPTLSVTGEEEKSNTN